MLQTYSNLFKPIGVLLFFLFFSFSSAFGQEKCGSHLEKHEYVKAVEENEKLVKYIENIKSSKGSQGSPYFPIVNQIPIIVVDVLDPTHYSQTRIHSTPQEIAEGISALNSKFANTNLHFYHLGPVLEIDNKNIFQFSSLYFSDNVNSTNYNQLYDNQNRRGPDYFYTPGAIIIYSYLLSDYATAKSSFPWYNDYGSIISGDIFSDGLNNTPTNNILSHEMGHNFGLYHTFQGSEAYGKHINGNLVGNYFGDPSFANGTTVEDAGAELIPELVDGTNSTTNGDMIFDTEADPYFTEAYTTLSINYATCSLNNPNGYTDKNGDSWDPPFTNIMSYACQQDLTLEQKTNITGAYSMYKASEIIPSLQFDIVDNISYAGSNVGVKNATVYYKKSLLGNRLSRTTTSSNGTLMGFRYGYSQAISKVMLPPSRVQVRSFDLSWDVPDPLHSYLSPYSWSTWHNGISVGDQIGLVYHVLYNTPLTAYQKVAADMNNDGSLNVSDILAIRKIILYQNREIWDANNLLIHPYVFIPEHVSQTVANFNSTNVNPFTLSGASYPDYITNYLDYQYPLVQGKMGFDMVKKGDLNSDNSLANVSGGNMSSRGSDRFIIQNDETINKGDIVRVDFYAHTDRSQIIGYQFAIGIEQDLFSLVDLGKGELASFYKENFNLTTFDDGVIRTLWVNDKDKKQNLTGKQNMFSLYLQAKEDIIDLSSIFSIDNNSLETEFYSDRKKKVDIELGVEFNVVKRNGFDNFATNALKTTNNINCYPNPAIDFVDVGYNANVSGNVSISLTNVNGVELAHFTKNVIDGNNIINLDLLQFRDKGLIFITIKSDDGITKVLNFIKH